MVADGSHTKLPMRERVLFKKGGGTALDIPREATVFEFASTLELVLIPPIDITIWVVANCLVSLLNTGVEICFASIIIWSYHRPPPHDPRPSHS